MRRLHHFVPKLFLAPLRSGGDGDGDGQLPRALPQRPDVQGGPEPQAAQAEGSLQVPGV